jgi:hypothetical protein
VTDHLFGHVEVSYDPMLHGAYGLDANRGFAYHFFRETAEGYYVLLSLGPRFSNRQHGRLIYHYAPSLDVDDRVGAAQIYPDIPAEYAGLKLTQLRTLIPADDKPDVFAPI